MRRVPLMIALALAAAAAVWAQQSRSNPCDAGNGGLTLPTGFCASVVADNLGQARHMTLSPSGDLYVMIRREEGVHPVRWSRCVMPTAMAGSSNSSALARA